MKTNEFLVYEAPQVEVVEVKVERGFASSGEEGGTNPLDNKDWN